MHAKDMSIEDIYRHLATLSYDVKRVDQIVDRFNNAALVLAHKIDTEGWKWRDNFLREYVGCAFRTEFTNTISPYILELFFRRYPKYRKYRDGDNEPSLF